MLEDLREIEEQYEAVEADLARPDIVKDQNLYR
jgi:hypothetical protein